MEKVILTITETTKGALSQCIKIESSICNKQQLKHYLKN